jgi:hypothetical protein
MDVCSLSFHSSKFSISWGQGWFTCSLRKLSNWDSRMPVDVMGSCIVSMLGRLMQSMFEKSVLWQLEQTYFSKDGT